MTKTKKPNPYNAEYVMMRDNCTLGEANANIAEDELIKQYSEDTK